MAETVATPALTNREGQGDASLPSDSFGADDNTGTPGIPTMLFYRSLGGGGEWSSESGGGGGGGGSSSSDGGKRMGEMEKPNGPWDEESGVLATVVGAGAAVKHGDKASREQEEGSHARVDALPPGRASPTDSNEARASAPEFPGLKGRNAGRRSKGDTTHQQGTGRPGDSSTGGLSPSTDPPGRYRVLAIHTSAVVLGLATWFSATAVSGQLKERWGIGDTASSVLTSSVNIGFVVGAVMQSILNAADLVRPQMLYFMGCVGAAGWNALVAAPINYATAVVLRFLTGASLSLVYPPSLKLISTWFKYRRGVALGTIIGGLALGSALPHLIVGAGGVGDRWRIVTYTTSLLALVSGFLVLAFVLTGPFPFSKAKFSLQTVPRLARNRGVVLATLGYCTHMWELYGLWTWFLSLYTDYLEEQGEAGLGGRTDELSRKRLASLVTFSVVGIGGFGCVFIGWIADARIGRCNACIASLAVSGSCAAAYGPLSGAGAPQGLLIPLALLWGSAAVAESAQFSAMATELSDQDTVGTALTLQMALGFSVTVVGIFAIPVVEAATSWAWTTVFLVPGPVLGIILIAALKLSPDAAKMCNGKG